MMERVYKEYKRDVVTVTFGLIVLLMSTKIVEPFLTSSSSDHKIAQSMLEQAYKWYVNALQDRNITAKLQHVHYASAFSVAARRITNDTNLEKYTGIDVHGLQTSIEKLQTKLTGETIKRCPRLDTVTKELAHVGEDKW